MNKDVFSLAMDQWGQLLDKTSLKLEKKEFLIRFINEFEKSAKFFFKEERIVF